MGRSFLAIAGGLVVTIVVTLMVDALLHAAGVYPPMGEPLTDRTSLIALSYRIVITIGGAWLTARLAPARPMWHALVLGVVGTLLGLAGVAASWNANFGPRWYPISLAVLAIPQCWLGGKIFESRASKR